ncbi:MAG TPA: DUF86 domain-containing protein [Synergistales bacterium]|jgi:uncharacterized protein YutE (UPF0331/DUF86 family)|nr:DUF86 domain-containing protein [Synergistales bacterium]MDI9392439.1 DUF86 domain-containing protein [Synergistota bacterium]MDY0179501.1 DUF86 domain-containing protein [Synergistaceae bacterium]MDD3133633.1 DUF86 domain-containing protein [Synergistales bacterium]MDD3830654.1 DUF86 domain-containing protein [Synergistales bacterium]
MPDRDVVLAKVATIQKCLERIREVTSLDPASLDDINRQDIFVLNLQRAIQASIDLASHIVASEGLGLPETVRDNFTLLRDKNVIDPETALKMEKMTGFRNIAIHNYQALNLDILKSILTSNLKDLEDFYAAVLTSFRYA